MIDAGPPTHIRQQIAVDLFDADFFASGILDAARFDALARAVGRLCGTYAVDARRFRFGE